MNQKTQNEKCGGWKSNGKEKKRRERNHLSKKMDKSEHGTNNKQLSFFKTGFFSRDEKVQKTRQQTGESTSFNE